MERRIGDLPVEPGQIVKFVMELLSPALHEKRARSIAFGVVGVVFAERLSVAEVGRAMARARGTSPKHGIKQVDRLLSNGGFDLEQCFRVTVPWLVAERKEVMISLDWTEYADDGHSRIAVNLITDHGRATPLVWQTVKSKRLKRRRNRYEDEVLQLLADCLPEGVKVTLLADRGFADTKLFAFLRDDLGWDFAIRIRGSFTMTRESGLSHEVKDLVPSNGQAREMQNVLLTRSKFPINVVCVHDKAMKEPWCIATTFAGDAEFVVKSYGRRFTTELAFRDEKDLNFGFGLQDTSIGAPERRDRFLFLFMLATWILTLLGAAGEQIGCDRQLKANTTAKRTHSLLRQGQEYMMGCASRFFSAIKQTFSALLADHAATSAKFALL